MIKYVIFDLDGVLIDSEKLHQDRMARFVKYFNLDMDPSLFKLLIGSNPKMNTMKVIYDKSNLKISYEEYNELLKRYDIIEPKDKLDYSNALFPNVKLVLNYLKNKNYKLALASSSSMEYIKDKLEMFELDGYFDVINSGRDLKESKPNPMIYLKTINDLKASRDECAIVEDSYYGILAASKACDFVIAKKDDRYQTDLSLGNIIINDLKDIMNIL